MSLAENDEVVVIRFWQEKTVDKPPSWRARITSMNDGQHHYANGIEETFAVVRSLLEQHDPQ